MTARSYLFVPGDKPSMLQKAATRGADALILDMEDAVAPAAKLLARSTITEHLDWFEVDGPEIWIRVNNVPELLDGDLAVARHPVVRGVFIPKVNTAAEVKQAIERIGRRVSIDAMIETGRAVLDIRDIASVPGVAHLTLGLADLGADLLVDADPDDPLWGPVRMQVVLASAAAGIESPIAPVSPNFQDIDVFSQRCEAWARAGYGGRQLIHPAQVTPANAAFAPTPEQVTEARRVLAKFEEALATGSGAIRDDDGTMLDEAFVRRARQILAHVES
jgi:citrate lyase subunit beta/citryl-CoA lyase